MLFQRVTVLSLVVLLTLPRPAAAQRFELVRGRWFDGAQFVARTMWIEDGYFASQRPEGNVERLDLSGQFIVPPFADGHSHNLATEWEWQRTHEAYLAEGTFYVLVMANPRSGAKAMRPHLAGTGTADVAYGEGTLTSTLGYPFLHYEPRAMGLHDPSTWRDHLPRIRASRIMEGDGYWFADSAEEVAAKLPGILAERPSHLKVALFYSERFADLSADTLQVGNRGLDPSLLPGVVAAAHAAGVRVAAHIETAYDFELAVGAGVDIVTHLPGYNLASGADPARFRLTAAHARLAGERGVVVTPTVHFGARATAADPAWAERRAGLLRENLTLLKEHGVSLAIGTDLFQEVGRPELEALAGLGMFSNLELLRMWAVTTPQLVFPTRRIGLLEPGYEASFLGLACDPLADLACTSQIGKRVKQGTVLP